MKKTPETDPQAQPLVEVSKIELSPEQKLLEYIAVVNQIIARFKGEGDTLQDKQNELFSQATQAILKEIQAISPSLASSWHTRIPRGTYKIPGGENLFVSIVLQASQDQSALAEKLAQEVRELERKVTLFKDHLDSIHTTFAYFDNFIAELESVFINREITKDKNPQIVAHLERISQYSFHNLVNMNFKSKDIQGTIQRALEGRGQTEGAIKLIVDTIQDTFDRKILHLITPQLIGSEFSQEVTNIATFLLFLQKVACTIYCELPSGRFANTQKPRIRVVLPDSTQQNSSSAYLGDLFQNVYSHEVLQPISPQTGQLEYSVVIREFRREVYFEVIAALDLKEE